MQLPERIVFATPRVTVGEWRCPREHPLFEDSGPIERHLVAFARTSVAIRHVGGRAFVADAGIATIYNQGQRYTRTPIHPDGDLCDWWAVDAVTAREIAAAVDEQAPIHGERPLRFDRAPVSSALYMRQRGVLLALSGGRADPLAAEESILAVVHDVLAAAAQTEGAAPARVSRGARDVADAAARELATSFRDKLTLDTLSQRVGASPFHLCRSFAAVRGRTLHRHLTVLRLRASLQALADDAADLSQLALDHGFSSHSHFTSVFRREYGVGPAEWRSRLRAIS